MYKVQLAVACLAAASSALQLTQSDDDTNFTLAGVDGSANVQITGTLTILEDQETKPVDTTLAPLVTPVVQDSPAVGVHYPGDNCCQFWMKADYRFNVTVKLCHNGVDTFEAEFADYNFNASIGSFTCGNSVAFDLCKDKDHCSGTEGRHGAGAIRSRVNHPSQTDGFVRLMPHDTAQQGAVTFFEGMGCTGQFGTVFASKTPGKEYYDAAALAELDIADNSMSSFMLPYGYSIDVVNIADDFTVQGDSITWNGPKYQDENLTMHCSTIHKHRFNDLMSSVAIYRTGEEDL